jgi:hypothetical protein
MLSIVLQIIECVSFITLSVLIWRVSKWPKWRIRAVVYGWAAIFIWALFWSILLPMSLNRVMDSHLRADTFPDGTIAAAALVGGWFWPFIIVVISGYRNRKKTGNDHAA